MNKKLNDQSFVIERLHDTVHDCHRMLSEMVAAKERNENNSSADFTSVDELFNFPLGNQEGLQLLEESLNNSNVEVKLVRHLFFI